MAVSVSAVVPTLGRSPLLVPCLEALRREGAEIVLVDQGKTPLELPAGLAGRILRPGRNLGFASGTNLGIGAATGEWIATVNDDAIVEPGWLAALVEGLMADPGAAAAQGVNLLLDSPQLADGCGLAWNRWWQAVQVGHGWPAPPLSANVEEVFGVSATAALYRRDALSAVAPDGAVLDPALGSYYEDVDLAVRLRAAGWRALLVPSARARHAGSLTGRTLGRERWRLIYRNRYVVAARLLGRGFWWRLPVLAARDCLDLGRALLRGDGERAAGIVAAVRDNLSL